jgi:hypothetical protein
VSALHLGQIRVFHSGINYDHIDAPVLAEVEHLGCGYCLPDGVTGESQLVSEKGRGAAR